MTNTNAIWLDRILQNGDKQGGGQRHMPKETAIWTEAEIAALTEMCDKKKTIRYIQREIPTHTKTEIRTKCRSLGLEYRREKPKWTNDELRRFKEDWLNDSISTAGLLRKYDRTLVSLRNMARRLDLGPRPYDDSYLTVRDIAHEMKVSKDRVRTWIRQGLKHHYSRTSPKRYLIDIDDLLEFLEHHQDSFDASKVSSYLFYQTPKWLKEKAVRDSQQQQRLDKTIKHTKFTSAEIKQIEFLFKMGRSNEEIGRSINRTAYSVESVLANKLKLSRRRYNQDEIDIIKDNIETHTIDEIVAMLPIRTRSGVIAKCEELGLKYHSKKKG